MMRRGAVLLAFLFAASPCFAQPTLGVYADSLATRSTLEAVSPFLETAYLVLTAESPGLSLRDWNISIHPECCPDSSLRVLWAEPRVLAGASAHREGWGVRVELQERVWIEPDQPLVLATVRFLAPRGAMRDCSIELGVPEGTSVLIDGDGRPVPEVFLIPLEVVDGLARAAALPDSPPKRYVSSDGVFIWGSVLLEPPYVLVAQRDSLWLQGALIWAKREERPLRSCDAPPEEFLANHVRPWDRLRLSYQVQGSWKTAIEDFVEALESSPWIVEVQRDNDHDLWVKYRDEEYGEQFLFGHGHEGIDGGRDAYLTKARERALDRTGYARAERVLSSLSPTRLYCQVGWTEAFSAPIREPELIRAELVALQQGLIHPDSTSLELRTLETVARWLGVQR